MKFLKNPRFLMVWLLCIFCVGAVKAADPVVTTGNAQQITTTSAVLYGTINANGKAGRYMFMYGTSKSYTNTTSIENFSALTYSTSFNVKITGLSPNTTYHYCLVANHTGGSLVYGSDKTFTTNSDGSAPSVTTYDATNIGDTYATFNGSVNPNGLSTGYVFEYGTSTSYGSMTDMISVGSGTSSKSVSCKVTGLKPGTKYYYRIAATNSMGPKRGSPCSFTTERKKEPTITSVYYQDVTENSATLKAKINSDGVKVAYYFEYGTTTSYGNHTDFGSILAGTTTTSTVDGVAKNLKAGTTYHFRLVINSTEGGYAYSDDYTFKTEAAKDYTPVITNVKHSNVTTTTVAFSGKIDTKGEETAYGFQYGTTTSYGSNTSLGKIQSGRTTAVTVSEDLTGLKPGTTYHYRLMANSTKGGFAYSDDYTFTTQGGDVSPTVTILTPTQLTDTSVRLRCKINPHGEECAYTFQYSIGTGFENYSALRAIPSGVDYDQEVYADITGLSPGTTYNYRVMMYTKKDYYSDIKSFTTTGTQNYNSPFSDCPSPDKCGSTNYGADIFEAAIYLYNLGIVKGVNGKLLPDDPITRAQLSKLALYGLYGGETKVPSTLVSDNFPSVYADLQNKSAYYYRPAKALLYLDYQDGVSPFDRNRSAFNPEKPIERNLTMKVLCETFNIKPLTSGTTPFTDFATSENCWGYAAKAKNLGITTATQFKPYTNCTRGDAILFLYRILKGGYPTRLPNNTENIASSDFFVPANRKPQNSNALRSIASGNFNFYEKDFFNIDGYMPLNFGVSYNSSLTEMPSDFYPVSPMGQAWSHTYNTYMNIIESTDNSSEIYVVHKSDGSMLMYDSSLKSLSEGNYLKLTRNSSSQYTLTTPTKTVYTFDRYSTTDGIFYLTKIKDIHGTEKTISYETGSNHRRVSSVSTLGRSLKFSYTGADLLSSVTDPSGRAVSFSYSNGVLASLTDAKGQKTTFNYGTTDAESGLLKTITLPKGNTVKNNYQQRKLTSTQTNSDTPTTVSISPSYANGRTTSSVTQPITSSKSLTTKFTMDASGKVTSAVDNESTDISITYGDSSNPTLPTRVKNNLSGITSTFSYNSYGLPTSTYVSGGSVSTSSSTTYNSDNQVTSTTDGNGNTTRYSYSGGALTSITDALGKTTSFTNNSNGKPTQITDAAGRKLNISYNSYGNMTSSTISALGISNSYVYDAVSRITKSTDGNGNSSTYSYDKNDNMLSATDAKSNTISYKYDANDNLTSITNAKGGVTSLTYNNDDLLTGQSFQGHSKSFSYYDSGALRTATSADGTTFSYTYDDAGHVTNNGYATFDYNSRGQLISVSKDGNDIDYSYDGLGRTSSVDYDGKTVSYSYDSNGNVTSITYPGSKTVSYSYDALNRVTAVTDWNGAKTTYSYNADGSIDYMQLPNKVKSSYSYDNGGRLTGMSTKRSNGSTIVGYGYTLDKNGNHVSVETSDVFNHDPILMAEDVSYSYNSDNRITKAGSVSFGFDGNGNTTSRSGRTMKYDKVNNLISVSGDFNASYTYDGLGQRRSATRNGVTTKYVLSGNNVVAETNSSGTVQYYYVYGPTGLISRISASGDTRYYVADVRGSIVAMTDASTNANLTHKYQYDEFGKVTSSEEENINRFRYVGNKGVMYEADNLTFMRARYYDESIGRFLSEDPIWSTNLYPYCDNNPITRVDPEGTTYSVSLAGINQDLSYIPKVYNNDYYNSFVLGAETALAVGNMVGNQDASLLKETWGRQKDIMGWSSSSSSSSTSSAAVSIDLSTLNNGQGMQMIHSSVDTHKGYATAADFPAKVLYITDLDGTDLNVALLARKRGEIKVEEILQKNPNFDSKKADFLIRSEIYKALQGKLPRGIDSPWQINY